MKKPDKRETVNLFFSAFLIIAFIVCAHFFTQFTSNLDATLATVINVAIYAIFGLLIFYATRVGDGKVVKRFSPLTLIILVLPSLLIIIASMIEIPFISGFVSSATGTTVSVIVALAGVALGYGIPYTFISGFELKTDEDEEDDEFDGEDYEDDDEEVLEGGVEADILEAQEEEDEDEAEDDKDEDEEE